MAPPTNTSWTKVPLLGLLGSTFSLQSELTLWGANSSIVQSHAIRGWPPESLSHSLWGASPSVVQSHAIRGWPPRSSSHSLRWCIASHGQAQYGARAHVGRPGSRFHLHSGQLGSLAKGWMWGGGSAQGRDSTFRKETVGAMCVVV